MKEALKEKDGSIETLSRQLVQAGIRHNVDVGSKEVEKDVLETEAQQKFYRRIMKEEVEREKNSLRGKVKQ
jgi:hypothetical protein